MCTRKRAKRVIVVVWILAFILAIPIIFGQVSRLLLCNKKPLFYSIRVEWEEKMQLCAGVRGGAIS